MALIGIGGACLFFGDGVITPAVSVLSAVEGLEVVAAAAAALRAADLRRHHPGAVRRAVRGTGTVGRVFGPVMAVWFAVIGVLGRLEIAPTRSCCGAARRSYGVIFCMHHGWLAFVALGAVVLSVTGAEALYADMGHFGASRSASPGCSSCCPAWC